jgi:hypothetical protein
MRSPVKAAYKLERLLTLHSANPMKTILGDMGACILFDEVTRGDLHPTTVALFECSRVRCGCG